MVIEFSFGWIELWIPSVIRNFTFDITIFFLCRRAKKKWLNCNSCRIFQSKCTQKHSLKIKSLWNFCQLKEKASHSKEFILISLLCRFFFFSLTLYTYISVQPPKKKKGTGKCALHLESTSFHFLASIWDEPMAVVSADWESTDAFMSIGHTVRMCWF